MTAKKFHADNGVRRHHTKYISIMAEWSISFQRLVDRVEDDEWLRRRVAARQLWREPTTPPATPLPAAALSAARATRVLVRNNDGLLDLPSSWVSNV